MKQPPPADKTHGILSLLEQRDGDTLADSADQKCKKISDRIYQCLCDSSCRHKFDYETISLCSWPHPDNPDRSPRNTPCNTTEDDQQEHE